MALITVVREGLATGTGSAKPIQTSAALGAGFQVDGPQLTYAGGVAALAAAAVTTDVLTLTNPNAGVIIRVQRIGFGGVATAAINATVVILKRTTQNAGGTFTNPPATAMDTLDPFVTGGAVSGVLAAYTANAATLGTTVAGSLVRAARIFIPIPSGAGVAIGDPEIVYGEAGGEPFKRLCLRQNEVCAINLNGTAVGAGASLNIWISWSEEADRGPYYAGF